MNEFLMTYRFGGHQYNVVIPAASWSEAEARVTAIGTTGRIEGSDVITIPTNSFTLPFAGPLARFLVWWKNR